MSLADRVGDLMGRARADLADLVAIPSVADPRQYPAENCLVPDIRRKPIEEVMVVV